MKHTPLARRRGLPLLIVAGVFCAFTGVGAPSAVGASTRSCDPVINPYPGTRYEGVNLRRIRATDVSCGVARRVARRAHRRAIGYTPTPSGVRYFTWHGWQVKGDITGPSDAYVATKGDKRVSWRF